MNFKKYNTGNHDLLECSTSVCDECRTFLAGIFVNSLAKGCSCVTEVVNKWNIVGKVFKDHNKEDIKDIKIMNWKKISDGLPNTGICTDAWFTGCDVISKGYVQFGKIYSDEMDDDDIKELTHWIREEDVPLPEKEKLDDGW